ncbi:MAG: dihydroorotate dehydrogenase electron transfer subunit [Nitrospirae bacterium]|nr:dihydroorotate dehydrogenase electron transfer subunit [Nitrospirota bacterium]
MRARVISNLCIKGSYYKLTIKPSTSIRAIAGQFLMIRPAAYQAFYEPLLPRPFSIHRLSPDGNLEILYKVVGKGTAILARCGNNDEIDFLGPLGNGFPVRLTKGSSGEILIVAGGIGVAPMLYLTESLRASCPEKRVIVFEGGRETVDLLCVEELKKIATEVILATQDGSTGIKGYVTEALEWYLHKRSSEMQATVYACGPNPMLKRIAEIVYPLNVDTYFSLEATMACGIGLCMGCAVKRKGGGYFLVCKDGPVFRGETIDFDF